MLNSLNSPQLSGRYYWIPLGFLLWAICMASTTVAIAQDPDDSRTVTNASEIEALTGAARQPVASNPSATTAPGINFFSLLMRGGIFMIPIAVVSLLVVTMAFERAFMLRGSRILPQGLVRGLGQLAREHETLEPRLAYKLCQQYPSAASNIIRTMLLKIGRPHSEVETAIRESTQREADRLYSNVKWLNLSAGIAPLLGLLGTVWGLIVAFHDTTQLGASQNRAEYLARGIYEALVTTLAGLIVAIPAAILSHYFEGKISNIFRRIEELMFNLMQQIEKYEGKTRFESSGKELVVKDAPSAPSTPLGDAHDKLAKTVKLPSGTVPLSTRSTAKPDRT